MDLIGPPLCLLRNLFSSSLQFFLIARFIYLCATALSSTSSASSPTSSPSTLCFLLSSRFPQRSRVMWNMQMAVTKMFSPRNFVCPESVLDGISIAICDKFAQGGASEPIIDQAQCGKLVWFLLIWHQCCCSFIVPFLCLCY